MVSRQQHCFSFLPWFGRVHRPAPAMLRMPHADFDHPPVGIQNSPSICCTSLLWRSSATLTVRPGWQLLPASSSALEWQPATLAIVSGHQVLPRQQQINWLPCTPYNIIHYLHSICLETILKRSLGMNEARNRISESENILVLVCSRFVADQSCLTVLWMHAGLPGDGMIWLKCNRVTHWF